MPVASVSGVLRISEEPEGSDVVALRMEGRLVGAWAEMVREVSGRVLEQGKRLALDLDSVTFVDHQGVAMLGELLGRGAVISRCAPFVAEQLRGHRKEQS